MKKIFNKYIFLVFIIMVFWHWLLPQIFVKSVPIICENLTYNTPFYIHVKNPHLRTKIIPAAEIRADKIIVKSKSNNECLTINNGNVIIRLLPLLSGNIHINKFEADNITFTSKLKDKVYLNTNFFNELSKTKVKCNNISIGDLNIKIWQPDSNNPATYTGNNIIYKANGRYLYINIDSKIFIQDKVSAVTAMLFLPHNNDVNKTKADIKVENLDLKPVGEYLVNYLPKDILNISGHINIDVNKEKLSVILKNCAVNMKDNAKSIIFPQELSLISDFKISRKKIQISDAEIKSPNISINISGTVSDYISKNFPFVNINVRINKSRIEDIINMLPSFKTEDIDFYKLKKYKFYGDIIGNLNIKGNSAEPAINGNIYINNGILTKPIPQASGAIVKLKFLGKYLNFDVSVPAGLREKVWVKGGVELYNVKYSDMKIWSTKNVDLAVAEEKVVPIHEILNFIIGPVPIMDIKGHGNININVKGNRKSPHVWGALNLFDVTANFNEIKNFVLHNADAVLNFDDENASFTLEKGFVNNKPININGTCNLAGKFDFNVTGEKQDINYLYNSIKTSTMIDELKNMIPDFDIIEGLADIKFKVFGNIKDIDYIKFNENLFAKGSLELFGTKHGIKGINIHGTRGIINFDGTSANAAISSFIGKAPFDIKAAISGNFLNLDANILSLNIDDLITLHGDIKKDITNIFIDVKAKYHGRTDKLEYDKVNFAAKIAGSGRDNKLKLSNGEIIVKNDKLIIKNLNGFFTDNSGSFSSNLTADNFSTKPNINGVLNLKNFELAVINKFGQYEIFPQPIRDFAKNIRFDKGKINLNASVKSNNMNISTDLGGIAFTYVPLDLPVKIENGSIYSKKDYIGLNKINILADGMPVLADGNINNIFTKRNFDIYINSKPKQEFIDKYINNQKVYPIKIKGDIVYNLNLKGVKDDFEIKSTINMDKDSSVYYLGATVGDIENAIVLYLNAKIAKRKNLTIKEFSYDKLISSQGTRRTKMNLLKANGGIDIYNDDLIFHDLHIKTTNPTDARIFNIIFRKPNIKQGQFTSDLKFNGKLSEPRLLGTFYIFETDIPFLDTMLKKISFNFKEKLIEISSCGEVLGNDIKFKVSLKNKLKTPYFVENMVISTKLLDFNRITNMMKTSELEDLQTLNSMPGFNISDTVIKNIKVYADTIKLRNLTAENVEADASFNDKKIINISSFKFKIANGLLNGNYTYNLSDNHTSLSLKAKNIDANAMSKALFDLENQIYGDLTGTIDLSCEGVNFNKCMETLYGNTSFNVSNGKMPKLGSLEYLLKASNLIKGGITGISMNGIIDLVTPLKTGEFSDIYGNIEISDGLAKDLTITSKGKDLNLFITGDYNFANSHADMEVFGLLSRKISTMFGPLGNVSLNTLLNVIPGIDLSKDTKLLDNINKIPGIEFSDKLYRKFIAEIKGNINGDEYVTSFKWIN